jgi:hypothetical protein
LFLGFCIFLPHAFTFHSSKLNIEPPTSYLINNDIYLIQFGFYPVAGRQLYAEGETIHKTIQKRRIHKRKQHTKQENNINAILKKNISQVF